MHQQGNKKRNSNTAIAGVSEGCIVSGNETDDTVWYISGMGDDWGSGTVNHAKRVGVQEVHMWRETRADRGEQVGRARL